METATFSAFTSKTSSSGHLPVPPSWNPGDLTHTVVFGLGFLLGFPGNIAVIILKPSIQHLSPVSRSLMMNLAVLDLLCLLTLLFWICDVLFSWSFGLVTCKLLTFLTYFSLYGNLMTVTLLSVQCYLVVVKQINTLNCLGAKCLLVLLWTASFIASIPVCVIRQLTLDNQKTYCTFQLSTKVPGVLIAETIVGFITLFIVAFSYICLYRKVNQAAFFNNPQTTRLVSSIIVIFFVLNFPYHVMNVLSVTAVSSILRGSWSFAGPHATLLEHLFILNSSLNPLLYAFTSCNFWKCTVKLNCCGRNSGVSQRQSNISITNAEQ